MVKSAKAAMQVIASLAVVGAVSFGGYLAYEKYAPHWPEPAISEQNKKFGEEKVKEFLASPLRPSGRYGEYKSTGDYLNYSRVHSFPESENLKLDANGIPMVRYGTEFQYNPVTVSNYALHEYGRSLPGKPNAQFWKAVDKLLEMQGADGALRYDFPFHHYAMTTTYPRGWVSGMAQGLTLSVLARAYDADKNQKYIDAGNKALAFLNTTEDKGGPRSSMATLDPSLKNYIFFEEYIGDKNIYTLNGFIFTILGLYDWADITGNDLADDLFDESMETLVKILPYYDFGGASSYDLTFITYKRPRPTFNPRYHSLHSALLHNLYSITGEKKLKEYENRWNPEKM